MPSDAHPSPPSPQDRREFYRITVTLPIRIQSESDTREGEFIEKAVNISGGGIGVTVNVPYQPHDLLSLALRLPDDAVFVSSLEVLRLDPLPYPGDRYRLHGRFIKLTTENRELLIRHILRFQREHLTGHYSV